MNDWKQKIFDHKHLDHECVENGCQSLFLAARDAEIAALRAALANPAPGADLLAEFKVKLDRILFCLYVSLALNFASYFILLLK